MSHWPGPTLEHFVMDALGIKELAPGDFTALMDLFEPHREDVERPLRAYGDGGGEKEFGPWSEYKETVMWDVVPSETWDAAAAYLASLRAVHA